MCFTSDILDECAEPKVNYKELTSFLDSTSV